MMFQSNEPKLLKYAERIVTRFREGKYPLGIYDPNLWDEIIMKHPAYDQNRFNGDQHKVIETTYSQYLHKSVDKLVAKYSITGDALQHIRTRDIHLCVLVTILVKILNTTTDADQARYCEPARYIIVKATQSRVFQSDKKKKDPERLTFPAGLCRAMRSALPFVAGPQTHTMMELLSKTRWAYHNHDTAKLETI